MINLETSHSYGFEAKGKRISLKLEKNDSNCAKFIDSRTGEKVSAVDFFAGESNETKI